MNVIGEEMTVYCCGMFYRHYRLTTRGIVCGKCRHPKSPKKKTIHFHHRPKWCPIKIIPLYEVHKCLDERKQNA